MTKSSHARSHIEFITRRTWKVTCGLCGTSHVSDSYDGALTWLEQHLAGYTWTRRHPEPITE